MAIVTALLEGISGESFGTEAYRSAVVDLAQGVHAARTRHARIEARRFLAADQRISLVAGEALATRRVIDRVALRVVAAAVVQAGVHAATVQTIAELMGRTILVVLAHVSVIRHCERKIYISINGVLFNCNFT